ncbi:MAG TPA: allantoicase, partial [Nocardioidaceae bacterium]|nr:allantoicase [Nocardioidaceae bacterium]
MDTPGFTGLPDLASRALGGSVVYANDDLFAPRESLIRPGPAVFDPREFGERGKVYDGWETRRRREPGNDQAIVRLGVAGLVHGLVVDTSWFTGNYPPEISVEAASLTGYPALDEVRAADWVTLVPRSPVKGDTANPFPVEDPRRFTHVRLTIYPDGGVARLRVHGEPVPDPRLLSGTVDLAALENGGDVTACSDMFYSSARNLLMPGRARNMGEGWENARRRDDGNDFVTVRLAGLGIVRRVVVDTSYFVGNAPGQVSLRGSDAAARTQGDTAAWIDLVPRTPVQPDLRHQFAVSENEPVSQVRLDVFPDGGLSRLRVLGELTEAGLADLTERF